MNTINHPITFTVPLPYEAYEQAETLCSQQSSPQKSQQVYLNSLAVYAVDSYLKCMGFITDLVNSESQDLVATTLANVADLNVRNLGVLECRPIPPNTDFMEIPPEVSSDRIGYIAVGLNESVTEATLLGFVPHAEMTTVPLGQLQSLENFLEHLENLSKSPVSLSQWFEDVFAASWEAVEKLIQPQPNLVFNFRSLPVEIQPIAWQVKRGKAIQLNHYDFALIVHLHQESEEKINVLIQVHPQARQVTLPPHLRLLIFDEFGSVFREVTSREGDDYIQIQLFGQPGEAFQVQLALGFNTLTENFVL